MENKTYSFKKSQKLSCGENYHQSAALYSFDDEVLDWEQLNGLELSYNDILDSSVALEVLNEFFDVNALVVAKHSCVHIVALGNNLNTCLDKALESDPVNIFNTTVAFSRNITLDLAKRLKDLKLEIIIAPSFEKEALELLSKDKTLKLIKINTPLREISKFYQEEIKVTPFGVLIQDKDTKDLDPNNFKIVTKKKPEQKELEDMIFAFKIAKHSKSISAVVVKDLKTLAIANTQSNCENAIEMALNKVCDSAKGSIVALDKTISSICALQVAIQQRVSGIIQPMGSIKDKEIIDYANKYEISMVSTGITHVKH